MASSIAASGSSTGTLYWAPRCPISRSRRRKITPAHDFNDHDIGKRHGLAPLEIFTLDAKINANAPEKYRGLDRYAARKAVLADLRVAGLVAAEKPHKMIVPRCGRTGEVVEPMLTDQWFVAMTKPAPAGHPFFPGKSFRDIG